MTNEKGGRPELGASASGPLPPPAQGQAESATGTPGLAELWAPFFQELGELSVSGGGHPAWGPLHVSAPGGWSELALWTCSHSRPGESLPSAGEARVPR